MTSALIGASSPEQVVENVAAASAKPLEQGEIAAINKILI
jgi:aryl-alcohol dehydrogenase-like predicted oxidoreductase